MKSILKLLAVTFSIGIQLTHAQMKSIEIPFNRRGDTTIAYTFVKEDIKKVGLQDLTMDRQALHFRFWITNQAVDIWTTDKQRFEGNLISYTTPYNPEEYKKPKKRKKFYHNSTKIDTTTSRQIYELACSLSIFDIPVQDSIKGWSLGSDGYSVSVEFSTPFRYSFKHYWGPHFQQNVREAHTIDTFYQYLDSTLDMSKEWSSFISKLPKGCYHTGTLSVHCNNRKKRKETPQIKTGNLQCINSASYNK
ncbi:hypothetical protein GO755_07755 [Spirosoma sp. HMF4905]|uniref:Uncharacterized protein n=1 Tax=Spirosoma arboris TaxID=2682092 RepID=A0A7K1S7V0_9BACT|nr:hypothetical protein [Spirosoma arboris]MVM29922.1 hypothetical protein [Spirosoma arboris]